MDGVTYAVLPGRLLYAQLQNWLQKEESSRKLSSINDGHYYKTKLLAYTQKELSKSGATVLTTLLSQHNFRFVYRKVPTRQKAG